MPRLEKKSNISNSTLYVKEYVSESRVICGCSVCDELRASKFVNMVYNEADLVKGGVSCRFCSELKKAESLGLFKDRDNYMALLEKSLGLSLTTSKVGDNFIVTDSLEFASNKVGKNYPLHKRYNDLVSIAYYASIKKKDEYGIHFSKPSHIVLKCEDCGFIKFVPVAGINKESHICPICSSLKSKKDTAEKKRNELKVQKDIESSKMRDFKCVKTVFSRLSTNKAMQKSVKTLEEKNPDFKVVDISKEGGATSYNLACKKCGSVVSCMRSNANLGECEFCKSRGIYERGYLFKNYVGSVFNGLKIVSQSDFTCDAECIRCKKVKENLDLYAMLGKRYYCDCAGSAVSTECPHCFAPLPRLTFDDIYSGKEVVCPCCNEVIDNDEFLIAIESMDYGNSLRSKLALANEGISDKASKKIRFGNKFAVDTLIVESDSVYKGNDEKSYYRCFCKKHNVGLTLSEDEIRNYNCSSCDDIRQKIIANPDAKMITL